jgi:D-alanyl-D-alanine carboxypeptidase
LSFARRVGLTFVFAVHAVLGIGVAAGPVAYAGSLPPPTCRYDDVLTKHRALSEWRMTLLDPIYRVTREYVPTNLVSVSNANIGGTGKIRKNVIPDLRAMAAAARNAGAAIKVTSAYRSWSEQRSLYRQEVSKYGLEVGREKVARPGHSEHHLGTTIDFKSVGGTNAWAYDDWATTKAGSWLKGNAWRFGFIMSYPDGKKSTVCYQYEPWHYRYVGREQAADIRASGLTLREYLWKKFH